MQTSPITITPRTSYQPKESQVSACLSSALAPSTKQKKKNKYPTHFISQYTTQSEACVDQLQPAVKSIHLWLSPLAFQQCPHYMVIPTARTTAATPGCVTQWVPRVREQTRATAAVWLVRTRCRCRDCGFAGVREETRALGDTFEASCKAWIFTLFNRFPLNHLRANVLIVVEWRFIRKPIWFFDECFIYCPQTTKN